MRENVGASTGSSVTSAGPNGGTWTGWAWPFHASSCRKSRWQRLEKVRKHFTSALFKLDGVKQVVGVDGEFWSPRKVLRRALWHERDHTEHIRKLL